ncbi:MAG: hypothetical protein M3290_06420 [Actinomycetota bacterium]|nr:hypothetical protein [Actinomycetota bacterium]
MIDPDAALETILSAGDEWQSWRALRISGDEPGAPPTPNGQDDEGAFLGPAGRPSPGATGEGICHLVVIGEGSSGAAAIAADWLEEARTPAAAWLDAPDEVPGELDTPGGARVWATASATAALLALRRDPGPRAVDLLRGESDLEGRFTGGAYPTFAAAAAYWLAEGPKTELAEWALRWAREADEDWWGPWELVTALTFWGAAAIPPEHATVDLFVDRLREIAPETGWAEDLGLTLRALEVLRYFDA